MTFPLPALSHNHPTNILHIICMILTNFAVSVSQSCPFALPQDVSRSFTVMSLRRLVIQMWRDIFSICSLWKWWLLLLLQTEVKVSWSVSPGSCFYWTHRLLKSSWNRQRRQNIKVSADQYDDVTHICKVYSVSTWLLDVQFARADAVDELGGFRGGAISLNQQVLVEVSHPAASLQFGVRGRLCTLTLSSSVAVEVHQVLEGAAVRPLCDRWKLMSARLLLPGHWTDGDRWRTSRHNDDRDRIFHYCTFFQNKALVLKV